jgi:multicomponent Na+:H+ antiporter subunit C
MTAAVLLALGASLAAGVYLVLSRDVLRCVLGLSILASAANLLLFASGRLASELPPLVPAGATALAGAANPLSQALVLTAIVIGFALTCFSLVLATRLVRSAREDDVGALRHAEPEPSHEVEPPLETPEPPGSPS